MAQNKLYYEYSGGYTSYGFSVVIGGMDGSTFTPILGVSQIACT